MTALTIDAASFGLTAGTKAKIHLQKSPNAHLGLSGVGLKFIGTSEGIFRIGQLMERIPKFINSVLSSLGRHRVEALDTLAGKGLTAWTWGTTFPRIVEVVIGAKEATAEAEEALTDGSNAAQVKHKAIKAAREVTEAVTMSCHGLKMAAGLVPQMEAVSATFATVADTVGLGHDSIALGMHCKNLSLAHAVDLKGATPEVVNTVHSTCTNHWFGIMKEVCSVASGVFGLLCAVTGAVVPGLLLIALSLTSTVMAVVRKLHQETMDFAPINFLDKHHVTLLS